MPRILYRIDSHGHCPVLCHWIWTVAIFSLTPTHSCVSVLFEFSVHRFLGKEGIYVTGWIVSSQPMHMLKSSPPGPQNMPVFGHKTFNKGIELKGGWALTQFDWFLYKRGYLDTLEKTERQGHMRTQGKEVIASKGRGLGRNPAWPHLGPGLLGSRTEKTNFCC